MTIKTSDIFYDVINDRIFELSAYGQLSVIFTGTGALIPIWFSVIESNIYSGNIVKLGNLND